MTKYNTKDIEVFKQMKVEKHYSIYDLLNLLRSFVIVERRKGKSD